MAGEQVEGLPDALQEWVYSRAEETGRAPQAVLARAVSLSRLLDAETDSLPAPDTLGDGAAAPDDIRDRVDDLDRRVRELDGDLDEKIDDVRSRVIQVKREADAKAPAEHDHEAFHTRLDDVETRQEPFFGLHVPVAVPGVPTTVLDPRRTWEDRDAYDAQARELARMFHANFAQFEGTVRADVAAAGPKAH